MSVERNLQLGEELLRAYNEHDLDRMVTFWGDSEEGLARREFQKKFWLIAFPDTYMEVIRVTAQDDRVVTEAIVTATHQGPLKFWVTEPIPATNKRVEFRICEITTWEDEKLMDIRAYLDRGRILKQLGLEYRVDWDAFS